MTTYILFTRISAIPKWKKAVEYIFEKSFMKNRLLGWGYRYVNRRLYYAHFRWTKAIDNPQLTPSPDSLVLWVFFSPFKKRFLRVSKWIERQAEELGYVRVAKLTIMGYRTPRLDAGVFHRLVYLYARSTDGVVLETKNRRVMTPEQYYQRYKSPIEFPFHSVLKKRDLEPA